MQTPPKQTKNPIKNVKILNSPHLPPHPQWSQLPPPSPVMDAQFRKKASRCS